MEWSERMVHDRRCVSGRVVEKGDFGELDGLSESKEPCSLFWHVLKGYGYYG